MSDLIDHYYDTGRIAERIKQRISIQDMRELAQPLTDEIERLTDDVDAYRRQYKELCAMAKDVGYNYPGKAIHWQAKRIAELENYYTKTKALLDEANADNERLEAENAHLKYFAKCMEVQYGNKGFTGIDHELATLKAALAEQK